jgi:WD40 repeat protein
VSFLADGDLVAAGTDGKVVRWDTRTHHPLLVELAAQDVVSNLLPDPVRPAAVNVVSLDGLVATLDVAPLPLSDSRLSDVRQGPPNRAQQLLRGAALPTGDVVLPNAEGLAIVSTDGISTNVNHRHTSGVTVVAFVSHANCFATGAEDGSLIVG